MVRPRAATNLVDAGQPGARTGAGNGKGPFGSALPSTGRHGGLLIITATEAPGVRHLEMKARGTLPASGEVLFRIILS